MQTIFQRAKISEPALFSPADTTKRIDDFPKICVSTFSDNIIQKFMSLDKAVKIAELMTANGLLPVYKINYKNTKMPQRNTTATAMTVPKIKPHTASRPPAPSAIPSESLPAPSHFCQE